VNGGRGERSSDRSVISEIDHDAFRPRVTMRSDSSAVDGFSTQLAGNDPPLVLNSASSTKYVSGTNAEISRSRSARMRRAGD
jgi:hypothetical protein